MMALDHSKKKTSWLSLTGGFLKLNIQFFIIVPCVLAIIYFAASTPVLSSIFPVSVDKVPYFVLFVNSILFFIPCNMIFVFYTAYKQGFNNNTPRIQKLDGVLHRLQSATSNQIESMGYLASMVVVGKEMLCAEPTAEGLVSYEGCITPEIFARLCMLFLLARFIYYPAYAMDLDLLRSFSFGVGLLAVVFIGVISFFDLTQYLV
ncbi:hypothetical protein AB1Y20_021633 [Prymnesium parvum]|uniref:Uncharacterized protein n=1 Tax=Prymnesium parvum TaxID=97485 RepID=A0AB34JK11_PRYPA